MVKVPPFTLALRILIYAAIILARLRKRRTRVETKGEGLQEGKCRRWHQQVAPMEPLCAGATALGDWKPDLECHTSVAIGRSEDLAAVSFNDRFRDRETHAHPVGF